METPRKPLNKYWCSVPHYLSDIRNIYIKADRFPLMMLTADPNTVVSNHFHSVKILLFSSARSRDFDGLIGIEHPVSVV
jgi:hypothetical protein